MNADFAVENHLTIFLLRPLTDAAKTWVSENIADDAQHFGGGIVVEHRYIGAIVQGARADGLVLR